MTASKATASSHHRAFFCLSDGARLWLFWRSWRASRAGAGIVIPEVETDPELVAAQLRELYQRGKTYGLVVVAEGSKYDADALAKYFHERHAELGFELRATKLGHIQRGGIPGAFDRLLATRLVVAAVDCLTSGDTGVLLGTIGGKTAATPLSEVVVSKKQIDMNLFKLANVLAQ